MKIKLIILNIVFLSLFTMLLFGQKKPQNIEITLSADKSEYSIDEPIIIRFAIKNNHNKKQRICKYHTPLEGFQSNFLEVINSEGAKAKYLGILKKRRGPSFKDCIKLAPGETKTVEFDLKEHYGLNESTSYKVRFIGKEEINKLPGSNTIDIKIK